ncbi:MAG: hypothetical protein H6R04_1541 [Burkholderiaceae bacterium]|nr:hypothetical protein [Burkholderiaceae bacterium]
MANGALLAFRLGYLDSMFTHKNEPLRMANQLNADKIRLQPPGSKPAAPSPAASVAPSASSASIAVPASASVAPVATAPPAAATAPTPTPVAAPPAPPAPAAKIACVEVGEFAVTDIKRIEPRLATLALGQRQSRRNVREVASHMVFIPSQGSKAGADKKAAELRRLGVTSLFIIQDNSALRWGISLGVFKTEAAARAYLASLNQRGVRSARVGARSVSTSKVAYQLRELEPATAQALDRILADFPEQKKRECVQ